MAENSEELDIGVLAITFLVAYEALQTFTGSASFALGMPNSMIISGMFAVLGVGLLAVAYGIYNTRKWAWYIASAWYGLLLIGDLRLIGTPDFWAVSAIIHAAVFGYLLWTRENFGVNI